MTSRRPAPTGAVILDTNVGSELMCAAPDANVLRWARGVPPESVYTTGAFAERVLPFDAAAANHYADIVVAREQAGAPIAGFDAQVAAICQLNRASLATRNTGDFVALDIDLVDPWLTQV